MRLRVICQKCGKTGVIETSEVNSSWDWLKTTDVILGLLDSLDWEIWFCSDCWTKVKELEELDGEEYYNFFEDILQPKESELEHYVEGRET